MQSWSFLDQQMWGRHVCYRGTWQETLLKPFLWVNDKSKLGYRWSGKLILGTNNLVNPKSYDEDVLTLLHSPFCYVGLSCRKWVPSSGSLVFFSPSLFPPPFFSPPPSPQAAERIGGAQGKCKKWGPLYGLCEGGLGHTPRKFWDLHALNCFWGSFFVHACSTYIPCKLPSLFRDFNVHRGLAGGLCSSHIKF